MYHSLLKKRSLGGVCSHFAQAGPDSCCRSVSPTVLTAEEIMREVHTRTPASQCGFILSLKIHCPTLNMPINISVTLRYFSVTSTVYTLYSTWNLFNLLQSYGRFTGCCKWRKVRQSLLSFFKLFKERNLLRIWH